LLEEELSFKPESSACLISATDEASAATIAPDESSWTLKAVMNQDKFNISCNSCSYTEEAWDNPPKVTHCRATATKRAATIPCTGKRRVLADEGDTTADVFQNLWGEYLVTPFLVTPNLNTPLLVTLFCTVTTAHN
jgi:hypothetical protein